jgi:aminopeptidase N
MMRLMRSLAAGLLLLLVPRSAAVAQRAIYDSGGPLPAEQAAYDVGFYDLALRIDPQTKTIRGSLAAHARVIDPLREFVLDLDTLLVVDSVTTTGTSTRRLRFERRGGVLRIDMDSVIAAGNLIAARVWYGGKPLEMQHVPRSWSDGVVWAKTAAGQPWISVVSVLNGSDIWWPTKDHPSDEPDSMSLRITVPAGLEVAANGRLRRTVNERDGTRTFHWFISDPTNNYVVSINIAPYVVLREEYESVTGERIPFVFWVLPEFEQQGRSALPGFMKSLRFLEETLGPYPFRQDKYGVVHTPYYGMEHQSITAYGSDFRLNEWGFDNLFFHELTHEWWANLVTARDWKDWWIHESFGSYMTPLYVERLHGAEAYRRALPRRPFTVPEVMPLAPRTAQTTREIYGPHIYGKGSLVLHTLRGLIGRDALLASIRRFAYPDPAAALRPGCRCRLADSNEFVRIVEQVSGRPMQWFFDVYLHQPKLPVLRVARERDGFVLRWETGGLPFPMPVEVVVDGRRQRLEMRNGTGRVRAAANANLEIDPDGAILMHVVQ